MTKPRTQKASTKSSARRKKPCANSVKPKARKPPVFSGFLKNLPVAMQYAHGVAAGEIPVNELVKLACKRHLKDLEDVERGRRKDIWFDEGDAQFVLDFVGICRHSKGEWKGEPIRLEPWQQFVLWVIFGWKRSDGYRRFRTAYIEVPRKNGKSTLLSAIGIFMLVADGEPGAEVYSAATKKDQAKIVWGDAALMVAASPSLKAKIKAYSNSLCIPGTASRFMPLSSDEDSLDGLNVHCGIIDELHKHKTRAVWDVIDTATGARRQPLKIAITTAGDNRESICWELHDYGVRVLERTFDDDTFFAFIAGIDPGDDKDWDKEAIWRKANPNYGVSVKPDDLKSLALKCRESASARNAFLQKRLNVWVQSSVAWMNMDHWRDEEGCAAPFDPKMLEGRACFAGFDGASTQDTNSLCAVFPPKQKDEPWHALWLFWIPGHDIQGRAKRDHVPFDVWAKNGLVKATEGDLVDYDVIRQDIKDFADKYYIREIAFDPHNATQIGTQLDGDGFVMVQTRQGYLQLNEPMKFTEGIVLSGELRHGNNPVATWQAGNVVAKKDADGRIRPIKPMEKTKRIDGMVALFMAMSRAMAHKEAAAPTVFLI